jgi:DNA-binding transcriptional MerR regulator
MATRQWPPESYLTGSTGSRISAMRVRLTIGDFSRMTHLSVITLRHYHEVGLLIPAEIDPQSGYRFYEPGQVRLAQVIRRFRDLGMPLDQIKEVLQAPDALARNQVITAHLRRMENQLAVTQSAVASLRSLLEQPLAAVVVEYRTAGPTLGLGVREQVPAADLDAWWEAAFRELDAILAAAAVRPAGPRGALYPAEFFELGAGEVVAYVPVAIPVPAAVGRAGMLQVPAAELAVAVHHGTLADVDQTYGALGIYVAEREIGADGPIREHYLVTPFDTDDESELVTEVCWPVSPTV